MSKERITTFRKDSDKGERLVVYGAYGQHVRVEFMRSTPTGKISTRSVPLNAQEATELAHVLMRLAAEAAE